jgi:magnesium chelatase family protein
VFFGELALDGRIKPVLGVLAAVVAAKQLGVSRMVIPSANLSEVQMISGIVVEGYDHLTQLVANLGVDVPVVPPRTRRSEPKPLKRDVGCFSEVVGQEEAVAAMKLAAVGGHHLLMIGPPGAGKTMLASRLPGILPKLSEEQAIEVGAIRSLSKQDSFEICELAPIQSPHHTASLAAMVGGGSSQPKPGLISLAHRGVLFLDEAPEFQSPVLEALRQPLESGQITISRSSGQAIFPARFQLVLAANPCPCGFAADTGKACTCSSSSRTRYLAKISGPLSDRIDLRIQLNPVNAALVTAAIPALGQTSAEIQLEVTQARAATTERLKGTPWLLNSEVAGSYLRRELRLPKSITKHLDSSLDQRVISMRGYDRCLRLAWSIADLGGRESPSLEDVSLAGFYRGSEL